MIEYKIRVCEKIEVCRRTDFQNSLVKLKKEYTISRIEVDIRNELNQNCNEGSMLDPATKGTR